MILRTWFFPTHLPVRRKAARWYSSLGALSSHDWLGPVAGLLHRQYVPRYELGEVRARLLQMSECDVRTVAVHRAAAQAGAWMRLLPSDATREHCLGSVASRLPSVIFWYTRGLSSEEIGRRLTPFAHEYSGERAIDAACTAIAALLNSHSTRR